jgi:predicted small secreted protein
MKFPILTSALVLLPLLLPSCNSSNATGEDGSGNGAPDLSNIGDYKGIANGTVTIGGKSFPIEFTASAYSKPVSIRRYSVIM